MELHLAVPTITLHYSFTSIAQISFLEDCFEILMLIQNHILLQVNLQKVIQKKEEFWQVLNQFLLPTKNICNWEPIQS